MSKMCLDHHDTSVLKLKNLAQQLKLCLHSYFMNIEY